MDLKCNKIFYCFFALRSFRFGTKTLLLKPSHRQLSRCELRH